MGKFLIARLAQSLVSLFVISFIVFVLGSMTGKEIDFLLPLDEAITADEIHELRVAYGLDKSRIERYRDYLWGLARGDLGFSRTEQRPVWKVIADRLPATLQLASAVLLATVAVSIPLGVLSAVKRGSLLDYLARIFAFINQAIPTFWLALVLILVFGVWLNVLPVAGKEGFTHYILPVIAIMGGATAGLTRLTRSAMLEVLDSEYIKLVRAKGVPNRWVIWKHALKNAMIPIITYIGLLTAGLLNGVLVGEIIFAWPGIGRVTFAAINERDFVLLQGVVLFIAVLYLGINFLVDVIYASVDPRIRYE
jgi:peptide/nickel transport system permease protein